MRPLEITRGDTIPLTLTVTREEEPVDLRLPSTELRFTARDRDGRTITKELDDGIEVDAGDPGNVATILIDPDDTTGVEKTTWFDFDVELTEPDGTVTTLVLSAIEVKLDVTV